MKFVVCDLVCKTGQQMEEHILIKCKLYDSFVKSTELTMLNIHDKFIFSMTCIDRFILGWLAKYVYK